MALCDGQRLFRSMDEGYFHILMQLHMVRVSSLLRIADMQCVSTGGSGYTAFKVLPQALHVYVDNLEVTSPHGIFKVV